MTTQTKYGYNEETDRAIFTIHGYHFGDRLLEGVFFEVELDVAAKTIVNIKPQDYAIPYFEKLNKEHWLEQARIYAEEQIEYLIELDQSPVIGVEGEKYDMMGILKNLEPDGGLGI